MIDWLQKTGGYTSNGIIIYLKILHYLGLTIEEKNELIKLRSEIRKYRDMESTNHEEEDNRSQNSAESVNIIQ
jgi:hypothetical protein